MIDARHDIADWVRGRTSIATRRRVTTARLDARIWNARYRSLPDFLVIGAQRCGTSSLYKYLGRHPRVIPSLRKEIEFFSTRYSEGEAWYRAHFPLKARMDALRAVRGYPSQTFEATPDYLLHPAAAERAAQLVPDARIIVLVRNPIDRAYSHFQHNRRLGQEPLQFEEALDQEHVRLSGELERISHDPAYPARYLRRYSYVTRGLYAEQLAPWRAQFAADRILIVSSEDLFSRTAETFLSMLEFLGLPPWRPAAFDNYSYASPSDRPSTGMPDDLRVRLTAVFSAPNIQFYAIAGRDFGWAS